MTSTPRLLPLGLAFAPFLPSTPLLPQYSARGSLRTRVCAIPRSVSISLCHSSSRVLASATPPTQPSSSSDDSTVDVPASSAEKLAKKPNHNPSTSTEPSAKPNHNEASKNPQPGRNAATIPISDPNDFADALEDDADTDADADTNVYSGSDTINIKSEEDFQTQAKTSLKSNSPLEQKESSKSELKSKPVASKEPEDTSSSPTAAKDAPDESSPDTSVSLNLSPEQKEKARSARKAAAAAAQKKNSATIKRNEKLLANVGKVLIAVGERTRTIELGRTARARAEVAVNKAIADGEAKSAPRGVRLRASAASAAKSVVNNISKTWNDRVVPPIRQKLPKELGDVPSPALASAIVGAFVAIVLLPNLFSGPVKKAPEVAKLDKDTAALEKKLARESERLTPRAMQKSPAEKEFFPSDDASKPKARSGRAIKQAPQGPPLVAPPTSTPNPKAETPKAETPKQNMSNSVTPKPEPPKSPPMQTQPERILLKDVTPDLTLSTVRKKLGGNGNLVLSASFDSLYAEPTVALTVSKSFHDLPAPEQRRIAEVALQACRSLGYDRVTLTEEDTDRQVAQAGIDVDLEDETENMRAEIASMRATANRLAIRAADDEMTIGRLNSRLEEGRSLLAKKEADYGRNVAALRKENSELANDLEEAKDELAKMPDRMELERRTIEAEEKSDKMSNSVEMLSLELAKARGDEQTANQNAAQAVARADATSAEKDRAVAAADARSEQLRKEADARADDAIKMAQKEAKDSVDAANELVRVAEEKLQAVQKEAEGKTRDMTGMFNKQLADEKTARVKDVQAAQKEADKLANDAITKAQKEAKASIEQAESRAKQAEDNLAATQKDAAAKLQEQSATLDKQLKDERAAREKDAQSASKKFETMMDDLQKKAKADLDAAQRESDQKVSNLTKEAKSTQAALMKERDQAIKETEKSISRAQKAADKAARDRDGLMKQIEKLQAKLKGKEPPTQDEATTNVKDQTTVPTSKAVSAK